MSPSRPGRAPWVLALLGLFSKELRPQALTVLLLATPHWSRRGPVMRVERRLMNHWHPQIKDRSKRP